MEDFRNGEWVEEVSYELCFYHEPGGGSAFPCDENGNVLFDKMEEPAVRNYNRCLELGAGHFPVAFKEVEREVRRWREPNSGICECGKRIELFNEYLGASECPYCGRWHNLFGELLNDPRTWRDGDDW